MTSVNVANYKILAARLEQIRKQDEEVSGELDAIWIKMTLAEIDEVDPEGAEPRRMVRDSQEKRVTKP